MLIYEDNEDSLESAIRTVEKSIRTPKMKKKGTTSTYETSVSRITDLRKKIPEIRNNRNKT
jgi:hypothetical protein